MNELWKEIPGYEGYYEASNLGFIRSVNRTVNGRCLKSIVLRQKINKNGYHSVGLSKDNKPYHVYVHQLVLLAFRGPCPAGKESRHKDGNKSNNRLRNLVYATHVINCADRIRHGTHLIGAKNPATKLTEKDVLEIRKLYKAGKYFQHELASKFQVKQSHISDIILRKRWGWL